MPAPREARDFPEYFPGSFRFGSASTTRPTCTGPIRWKDFGAVERDLDNLKQAATGARAEEIFVTAVSPGQAARFLGNRFYPTHEAYVRALGAVLREEYAAIAGAGFSGHGERATDS